MGSIVVMLLVFLVIKAVTEILFDLFFGGKK